MIWLRCRPHWRDEAGGTSSRASACWRWPTPVRGALWQMTAAQLAPAVASYGVPLTADVAEAMAEYFAVKRGAVLRYNR